MKKPTFSLRLRLGADTRLTVAVWITDRLDWRGTPRVEIRATCQAPGRPPVIRTTWGHPSPLWSGARGARKLRAFVLEALTHIADDDPPEVHEFVRAYGDAILVEAVHRYGELS